MYNCDVRITKNNGSEEHYTNANVAIIGVDFDFEIYEPMLKIQISKESKVYIKVSSIKELHIKKMPQ